MKKMHLLGLGAALLLTAQIVAEDQKAAPKEKAEKPAKTACPASSDACEETDLMVVEEEEPVTVEWETSGIEYRENLAGKTRDWMAKSMAALETEQAELAKNLKAKVAEFNAIPEVERSKAEAVKLAQEIAVTSRKLAANSVKYAYVVKAHAEALLQEL